MELLLIAIGLAMDATAVAAAIGASHRADGGLGRRVVQAAVVFGMFQAGMSGIGMLGGHLIETWAAAWDHWIAFGLLAGIGGQMVRKAGGDDEAGPIGAGWLALLGLGVATSLDALAAGVTLPVLDVPGAIAVGVIGSVTLAMATAGGFFGKRVGDRLGARLEIAGGVALIGIGLKILVEHLLA